MVHPTIPVTMMLVVSFCHFVPSVHSSERARDADAKAIRLNSNGIYIEHLPVTECIRRLRRCHRNELNNNRNNIVYSMTFECVLCV